uniref:Ribonuclease E n=1 Tax=Corynoplastis japonica TaxID=700918 RepID=A0A1X9PU48_9RHOD|nr:ribonuclease E [Corynoplastis japonica]
MKKSIIISDIQDIAAIFYDRYLYEIVVMNVEYQLGNIYIGKVEKIFPSINAAFISTSLNQRSGFLNIQDCAFTKTVITRKHFINYLNINQKLLVQVIKEGSFFKGPRFTTNITILGPNIILMPFNPVLCISKKIISSEIRNYLKSLFILIKPITIGILFKSSSIHMTSYQIIQEIDLLKQQWCHIQKTILDGNSFNPCIYNNSILIKKIFSNMPDKTNNIVIDSIKGMKDMQYYFNYLHHQESITKKLNIKLYKGSKPIFHLFNFDSCLKKFLSPKITLSCGGYIIIDRSEALTVIDVNSGSLNSSHSANFSILTVNFQAAKEIAYQIQVRNITGVLIIDFIDMHLEQDQFRLINYLNDLLEADIAKPQIVQLSELGLVEITRRKRKKSLYELFDLSNSQINYYEMPYLKSAAYQLDMKIFTMFQYKNLDYKQRLKPKFLLGSQLIIRYNHYQLIQSRFLNHLEYIRNK